MQSPSRRRRHWTRWLAVALLVWWGLTADTPPAEPAYRVVTRNYLPGVPADVYLPDGVSAAPVVILVPGGAWLTADRTGLTPLARRLAREGIVAVNTTHRAVGTGAHFPQPVADVICSIDFAVHRAEQAGIAATAVVVLGHSSGAHLAALAALGGDAARAAGARNGGHRPFCNLHHALRRRPPRQPI